jgi:hypothetical protein
MGFVNYVTLDGQLFVIKEEKLIVVRLITQLLKYYRVNNMICL